MSFFGKWNLVLSAAVLLLAGAGCSPMDSGPMDEEKEPHYVLGKSRVNAMDYDGALRAFDESLEANPHSAQAHYQMAMLYENQESDPAAAIYHYQQFLKFDPKTENAEIIAQHIASCKQQLAADVLQLPSAPAAQQQLEKLTEENRRLHDQLTQWQAYYAAQQAAAKTNPPTPRYEYNSTYAAPQGQTATAIAPEETSLQGSTTPLAATTTSNSTAAGLHKPPLTKPGKPRSHLVTSGETMASIARKQDVSLAALEAANPGVNPKKLRAGQTLNVPTP
jgi:tetratricopeptide (TPR) repeat protein